jgi:hypothetical protein
MVMMVAVGFLSSLLALATGAAQSDPVRVVPFQCGGVSDRDVQAPLRVELRDQLLDPAAPTPADAAIAAAEAVLRPVLDEGEGSP